MSEKREVVKVFSVFDLLFLEENRAYEYLEKSRYRDNIVTLYVGMMEIDRHHLDFSEGVHRDWFKGHIFESQTDAIIEYVFVA